MVLKYLNSFIIRFFFSMQMLLRTSWMLISHHSNLLAPIPDLLGWQEGRGEDITREHRAQMVKSVCFGCTTGCDFWQQDPDRLSRSLNPHPANHHLLPLATSHLLPELPFHSV